MNITVGGRIKAISAAFPDLFYSFRAVMPGVAPHVPMHGGQEVR